MSLPIAVKAGAIAVSVTVAAAIAVYESPELRRYTDDVRRRIALALYSMSEGIQPPDRPPMFNRPEDAHGFFESRRGVGAEPGVDADDESRRRQREEMMYWNALHMEKKAREQQEDTEQSQPVGTPPGPRSRSSTFDDFLRRDESGEKGTFVFNTGADVRGDGPGNGDGVVRRRHEGVRGLNSAIFANPFADEHQIDRDEMVSPVQADVSPDRDEIMSDIYSATTRDTEEAATPNTPSSATPPPPPPLVDISTDTETERSQTLERDLGPDEYMTAGQGDGVSGEAFTSIQAWAQQSSDASTGTGTGTGTGGGNFYSPLPMSPDAPMSEPEMVSEGVLTPTDSVSLAGSGEDVANDVASYRGDGGNDNNNSRPYDVLSDSEGMLTPASWSEVGSVVSENDGPAPVRAS